jgi:hypothetical protein
MANVLTFTTNDIAATPSDDEGVASVFVANNQGGTDAAGYFTLSRMLDDDDGYYLERDDQAWGGYGGVASIALVGSHLHVCLTELGAQALGGVTEVRVAFAPKVFSRLPLVREALEAIFSGTGLLTTTP